MFLAQPNNPTGTTFDPEELKELVRKHPESRFVIDESFADFAPGLQRLAGQRPANVITVVSMTKFYAIPGLRLGLAFASPDIIMEIKNVLPCWSVNILTQKVGLRCLRDEEYERKTIETTVRLREDLAQGILEVPGIRALPSQANFMLCQVQRVGMDASGLIEHLIKNRVAVRHCDNFDGLDSTYFRIAVRTEEENRGLLDGLRSFSGMEVAAPKPRKTPALMIQGTCSNAGKSILAAAFCRIFLQDGFKVAPFKAQNMSLNSFVTDDGLEMGRIKWNDSLNLGVKKIDEQHQNLVQMINEILEAFAKGKTELTVDRMLGQLHEYMEKSEYPYIQENRNLHARLKGKVKSLRSARFHYEEVTYDEIKDLLSSWLIEHILREDYKIVQFVKLY